LDLSLSASAGTQVKLRWNASRHDDSVDYRIWFRHLDSSRFRCVDSADHTSYVHEPLAQTGDYTVSARLDSAEEFAADTLSTIPVATDTIVLPELNRDSLAGYGWDASTRLGRRRTMRDSLRAGEAAFYFTDFAPGWSGPFYYLASPDLGPQDPGGVVPAGPWPSTGFFPLWGSNQDPLPEYDSLLYQDAVDIGSVRTDVAVHVADGYYALVATLGPDTGTGSVRVLSWCQAVRGLRLIRHYEDTLTRRVR
jgi:hypothetical protein